jgi:hypothetical protein
MSTNSDPVVSLNYSIDDFFYTLAKDDATDDQIKGRCSKLSTMSIDCTNPSDSANTWQNCYNLELCKNKEYVDWIKEKQAKHQEHVVNATDIQSLYVTEIVKMINLGVGIAAIIIYIYYNR